MIESQVSPAPDRRVAKRLPAGVLFRHPPRLRDWLSLSLAAAAYATLVALVISPSSFL
ncbi:hypothetical protein [Gemmobacter serpentinus]|uniref:hypothetical protein n=1 Tax=Gemmobacter serpentinus TaxID=2652247 RepID=UPI00186578AA|nr:hypothetical protein [Gemmobacter serpentinus]